MARAQFESSYSDDEDVPLATPELESESESELEHNAGFAQFVDSDDDDGLSDESDSLPPKPKRSMKGKAKARSSEESDEDEEKELKQGLASIPFGDLLRAQETLSAKAGKGKGKAKNKKGKGASSESESDSDSDSGSDDSAEVSSKHKGGKDTKKRSAQELAARRHKNAPTEESSSRPVSRRRQVVEVPKLDRRDPRFSALSGQAKQHEFKAQYGFLKDVYVAELTSLRERYKALVKKERSARGAQAEAFAYEREQVGRELDRAQALAAERRRRSEADELETEQRRLNRQRLAEGKKAFYLKKSDKKQLLLRKRYERLAGSSDGADAGEGGSNSKQLRKALERRRKRNAAKERKNLPFVADPRRAGAKPKRS